MSSFVIIVALVALAGLAVMGWMFAPTIRAIRTKPEQAVRDGGDVEERVAYLRRPLNPRDRREAWVEEHPLRSEQGRLPEALENNEQLPVCGDVVVPLTSALFRIQGATEATYEGRRMGRAFHLVRVRGDLFFDLIEAIRLVPVIGAEVGDRARIELRGLSEGEGLRLVAPWLVGAEGRRVLPTGAGRRVFVVELEGGRLEVEAWIPAVREGIAQDRLCWAGIARWSGEVEVVTAGATPRQILAELRADPQPLRTQSLRPWTWSRLELIELASVGMQLADEGISTGVLVEDSFADRVLPRAAEDDEVGALAIAATLNWGAVQLRRAGLPLSAICMAEAGLRGCHANDDDGRADLLYNRGLALLVCAAHTGEGFELALHDFQKVTALRAEDPAAWIQMALVYHLQGESKKAEDAWLQAGTRTRDVEQYQVLMRNAGVSG